MSAGATFAARLSGARLPLGGRWRQSGQGMVEYAFILVLISVVVIVMLITTGGQIKNLFSDITYTLNNQAGL
jgi:Flp pilus assembly pilin Flp